MWIWSGARSQHRDTSFAAFDDSTKEVLFPVIEWHTSIPFYIEATKTMTISIENRPKSTIVRDRRNMEACSAGVFHYSPRSRKRLPYDAISGISA